MRITPTPFNCCGCTACANICPHHAIKMIPDDKGFAYPTIDDSVCIDCGLCTRTCQFHKSYQTYNDYKEPFVFGARQKDKNVLKLCQTGGLSSKLIEIFLSKKGFAYGVGYTKDFIISHIRIADFEVSDQFRGSKYVQSNLSKTFISVKEDLKNKNRVLFIGTPCQVIGLKSFIPQGLHSDLYTIDLVCHCCSSPLIWKAYLNYIEEKYRSTILKPNFRNKKFGWKKCIETYDLLNGKTIISRSFIDLYFKHLIVRPSCTNCPFTNLNRVGDITLGDFWGWEKKHQEYNDDLGINLVLVNSTKGKTLFDECLPFIDLIESNKSECLQPQLKEPITLNKRYDEFWDYYLKYGIKKALYKYGDKNYIYRLKKILYRLKKRFI